MMSCTPLQRKSAMKRGAGIKRVSSKRAVERREYAKRRVVYLEAHPLCQIMLAVHRIDESKALELLKTVSHLSLSELNCGSLVSPPIAYLGIPFASEIHHRNKCRGARLNDERWWMAGSREGHDYVEKNKKRARAMGLLLEINADEEGIMPDGSRAIQTNVYMDIRAQLPESRGVNLCELSQLIGRHVKP